MSCLFNSFSEYLRLQEKKSVSSSQLRQEICDYLSTDPIMLNDDKTKFSELLKNKMSLKSYVEHMRKPSTWGSGFEINAFCNLYHVNIHVKVLATSKDILFVPLNCCTPKNATLLWTGSHYTYTS